ncbi:DUF3105 domain-containing protein [Streptomyces chartreusis]|uniref:DUF3105 domain-containing protein n=1 Tax=Streptomyces chartreusis TaxID=1969 RepID=UPI00382A536F
MFVFNTPSQKVGAGGCISMHAKIAVGANGDAVPRERRPRSRHGEDPMNPPVGGDHHQAWMTCDGTVYTRPIANENAVHSLEHGAVWITYDDKATDTDIRRLGDRVSKTPYTLMSPVEDLSGTITLSAWGRQLTVDTASEPRIEQFLAKYVQGPRTPEPGAACTGGLTAT